MLPGANEKEAALVPDAEVYPAQTLMQVEAHFSGQVPEARLHPYETSEGSLAAIYSAMAEVKRQAVAKHALEIAAAGGHSMLPACTADSNQ